MRYTLFIFLIAIALTCDVLVFGQQVPDSVEVSFKPLFKNHTGPVVVIDEHHQNMHTLTGGYMAFGRLLSQDGYRVQRGNEEFSGDYLKKIDILVIVNAVGATSAFTESEEENVVQWVRGGGSLFLVADHMPFAGFASSLAKRMGVTFHNGFAIDSTGALACDIFARKSNTLEGGSLLTKRFTVDSVASFLGSAIALPETGIEVLKLGKGFRIHMPDEPWMFDKNTPSIPGEGLCQGGIFTFGKGKVVVWGEAAMFTAQRVGDYKVGMNTSAGKNNYKLLLNLMQWLSE